MKQRRCELCREGAKSLDYKDVERLSRYISQKGKMVSRRSTGFCAIHQRSLSRAIKRARQVALLPFIEMYYN